MDNQRLVSDHLDERVVELVDHINSAFFWVLGYIERKRLPVEPAMEYPIRRLASLLNEISNPPDESVLGKIRPTMVNSKRDPTDSYQCQPPLLLYS